MSTPTLDTLYADLKAALADLIDRHNLAGSPLQTRCRVRETAEAIGSPEYRDYPIPRGREHMVEASFDGSRGQAFADEFENLDGPVETLLELPCDITARRAIFIAGLNAVCRRYGVCERTIHCRDEEPRECAKRLDEIVTPGTKVLLMVFSHVFSNQLARFGPVRTVDLDPSHVGTDKFGIPVEPAEATPEAIAWCDMMLVTGSALVNGTITTFLGTGKPVVFFGVTISAAANVLGLRTFCHAPLR